METEQPSRAKAFFEEIKQAQNPPEFLKRLAGSGISSFESEFLEFKGGQNLDIGGDDVTKLWSKNLSCFANSDGGVLIFGIDAPKGKALHLSLVQDVEKLSKRLMELAPRITEPPVQRVEILSFPEPSAAKTGFVVCYIPTSPWRPHQVRWDGQPGQFYIRAMDNCVPCSHSTLRALFSPQFTSRLDVFCQHLSKRDPIRGWTEVVLRFSLLNSGPSTASEVIVLYEARGDIQMPDFDHRLWTESASGTRSKAFICSRSIHPEEKLPIFQVVIGAYTPEGNQMGAVYQFETLRFNFSISARNQVPSKSQIVFRKQDLNEAEEMLATPLA